MASQSCRRLSLKFKPFSCVGQPSQILSLRLFSIYASMNKNALGDRYSAAWEDHGHPEASLNAKLEPSQDALKLFHIVAAFEDKQAYLVSRSACKLIPPDSPGLLRRWKKA